MTDAEDHGGAPRHTNALIDTTSPYLLQHAHNPVDWYPWGEAALRRAREEDKPIFLSIGYAACHWCHVMEHESFENPDIASVLNEHFISIKVDREQRPDLDDIYMTATVAMSGHGGWPMTVFLAPDLRPFYAGTYFPPVDRFGRPGFLTLVSRIAEAWQHKRDDVMQGADGLTEFVQKQLGAVQGAPGDLSADLLEGGIAHLRKSFDAQDGGWGGAPKFPSSPSIMLLLRAWRRTGDDALLHMATHTLDRMAMGGMYDQLGGGFARYSVDAHWLVPHFEKMLYDNGQLAQVYLEAYQATGEARYRQTAEEVFGYVLRDLRDEGGAFYSSEDADSEGEEGKFYIWTHDELRGLLAPEDAQLFCAFYNVQPGGNFDSHEHYHAGQNILHRTRDVAAFAEEVGRPEAEVAQALERARQVLLAHRAQRVRPGLDDKILTGWNGLMITALAQGARVLDAPAYGQAAAQAAHFILRHMRREDGRLYRTHRAGESGLLAYLDDYAFFLNALVDVYEATFDPQWLAEARSLAELLLADYHDAESGLFYFASAAHDDLLVRARPTFDGSEPSGNSVAALALLRLGTLGDVARYREVAEGVLRAMHLPMSKLPQGHLRALSTVDWLLHGPVEVALAGPAEAAHPLVQAAYGPFVPNKVVALRLDSDGVAEAIPLLAHKTPVDGMPAAYVCRNYTCDAPVTDPEALRAQLEAAAYAGA